MYITACHSTCATCNGALPANCLSCKGNDILTSSSTCAACHPTCEPGFCSAEADANKCTKCPDGTGPVIPGSDFACAGEIFPKLII